MDESCNLQMQSFDYRLKTMERRQDTQEGSLKAQYKSLSHIERTLFQIKWMVAGALMFYLLTQVGIVGLIKGFVV